MGRRLSLENKFDYARAGTAVLRALEGAEATMRYEAFAKAIGLMGKDDDWSAWYRTQTRNILVIMAATERYGKVEGYTLDFGRIVDSSGAPGAGFAKESRIVRSRPR